MDEIALLRALAPGAESPDAARAATLQALEARFERASVAPPAPVVRTRRRGVLALAGATAIAAIVAAILLVSSGPSAESAAAEVLRQTAAVAADHPSGSTPGPGQFLYTATKSLELQEWVPGEFTGSYGGVSPRPRGAFNALISWREEAWMSAGEPSRRRSVLATPHFLSSAEQSRWEAASSPLPSPFEGGRVRDFKGMDGPGFRDFSALPTEPEALRLAIEQRQAGQPLDTGRVVSELWDILDKPNTTTELRAAVFGALAELPGIELNRDASDLVGRSGYALSYERKQPGYGAQLPGLRVEYIFDPESSAILGRREVVTDPGKIPWLQGVPAGTVRREVAYLQSGVVDSTDERPGDPRRG